jgi:hypothetical protein
MRADCRSRNSNGNAEGRRFSREHRRCTESDRLLTGVPDRLILQFRLSAPRFFLDYQRAPVVVDRGGGRNAPAAKPAPPKNAPVLAGA